MVVLILMALMFQLQIAPPPVAPPDAVHSGLVVFDTAVNHNRQLDPPRLLHGPVEFIQHSRLAMEEWEFGAQTMPGERVSVIFFYRSQTLLPDQPSTLNLAVKCCTGKDRPALPKKLVDPGYPINSIGEGAVILQLRVDAGGNVESVHVARPEPSLTDAAVQAVRQWQFSPATKNGKPAASIAIAVINFRRPAL